MCEAAPTSRAAFDEANRLWPGRSRASDGTCPGGAHHVASPTSDHEPDPALNNWSCAYDLTHDPAHGCDAHALAEIVKLDPRVKYVVRSNGAHDEIWNNELGDRAFRPMSKHDHASHLHVSLRHRLNLLTDTRPWFRSVPVPLPEEEDVAEPQMIAPTFKLDDGTQPTCLTVRGDHRATKLTREEADVQASIGVKRYDLPRELWRLYVIEDSK